MTSIPVKDNAVDPYIKDSIKQTLKGYSEYIEVDGGKTVEFRNESGFKFHDISSEAWRTYDYGHGKKITIVRPLRLHVSPTHSHRIFAASGRSHYVPAGYIEILWEVREGQPHFHF